jgi:hypothetical protein
MTTAQSASVPSLLAWRAILIFAACVLLGAAGFAALGSSVVWGTFTIVERWVLAGGLVVMYLASAFGLGAACARGLGVRQLPGTVQFGLGLSALLTISHGAGALGLMAGSSGAFAAWALLAPGLVLTVMESRRAYAVVRSLTDADARAGEHYLMTRWAVPGAIAAGVMLGAACLPAGVVWRSEFGGFDSLSYHLQLPKEWLQAGRIETLAHNVYSGLPNYLEAAFTHVAWLRGPTMGSATGGELTGILADEGMSLVAAQLLHAALGVAACSAAARVAHAMAMRITSEGAIARGAAGVTFSLLMLTPWTLVTGSLSYNEQGVALLAACAGLVLLADVPATRRMVVLAVLVGAAASIKPTAMLFVGVPVGLIALVQLRGGGVATGARAVGVGVVVGLLMLAPWMARNVAATGNPVFPFAARVFANDTGGTGWWNAEQVERFARSHAFAGSVGERLKLVVVPDVHDPVRPSWRGVTNPQWGVLIIAGVVAVLVCCVLSHRREAAARGLASAVLVTLVAQLLLWLFATHLQSRFLLPVALPCAVGLAMLLALMRGTPGRVLLAGVLVLTQAAFFVRALVIEHERGPAFALLATAREFTGLPADGRVRAADLSPTAFVNTQLASDAKVLLLGDATPLYFAREMVYATTYDTPAMFGFAGVKADDAGTWTRGVREAGVTHVLVNLGELDRYRRSGFLDPRLEMGRVQAWAMTLGRPLATWGNGVTLFAVPRE